MGAARGASISRNHADVLSGLRVLDLCTPRAELAGRVLADLGAEVLKIEPPEGSPSRRIPPFEGDRADDVEASLYWIAVALGKRSAIVDFTVGEERSRLVELAACADVVLESFDPGTMDALGLGWEDLQTRNPRLIYASVTPYGQDGPKAHWPASELVIEAAGGRIALQGDRDRTPLPIGFPQAAFHAGVQVAADVVIALNEREHSGKGQRLDTSMQEVMIWTLMGPGWYPAALGVDPPGAGEDRRNVELPRAQRLFPRLCECADGYIVALLGPSLPGIRGVISELFTRLADQGELDPRLRNIDWANWAAAFHADEISDEEAGLALAQARRWIRTRTKRELLQWSVERDLLLAPVHTTRDLLDEPQLVAREFFQEVAGRVHPAAPVRLSRTPIRLDRAAPQLGADQKTVDLWLGHPPAGSKAEPLEQRAGEAFAGLRVADLSWVVAGPTIGKALADHGATVVRVESSERVDLARRLPPFKDGEPGKNRSFWADIYNTSKLSAAVNLGVAPGRELARRIIDWADVVIESFSPGTMQKHGLDYETLTRERNDLIMLSTCLLGQTGPRATYAGYGGQGAAFAGLHSVTGWADRAPCGPFGPYTDVIAPKYGIAALGAAILERRRSGLGQHIDLSQVEASIHFIEPLLLDETTNGRTATAAAMDSARACPHGIYPTLETERYVAIAVETPRQWRALRELAPLDAFSAERYDKLAARLSARDEIDRALLHWCEGRPHRGLEALLVEAGVPASVVQRPLDLHEDAQLAHRGFHVTLDHAELGPMLLDAFPTRFSAKPRMLHTAAPCLGQHTDYVLRELLGLTPVEIQRYADARALD